MLWWCLSAFFAWLSIREIYFGFVPRRGFFSPNQRIWTSYVAICTLLATAFAYIPLRHAYIERYLTGKARILSESEKAFVHCNTFFDTVFDSNVMAVGHASLETGRIVLQYPLCGQLMDHLRSPEKADPKGMYLVHVFAHEAMHIRGERNEAVTNCQAIQRYYRTAKMFGIPDATAKVHGLRIYDEYYQRLRNIGGMIGEYYSEQCAPGKALDERLDDSTWK